MAVVATTAVPVCVSAQPGPAPLYARAAASDGVARTSGVGFEADARRALERQRDQMPPYAIILDGPADQGWEVLDDSTFNAIAASTIFKVNRTELNLRDPLLRQLADSVLPLANRAELMLVGIDLRGAASPEGPYWNNVRLSKGRAAALRSFLSQRLDSVYITDDMAVNTIAEDYPRLLWIMEQRGDPDAPRLRAIIDRYGSNNPEAIKRSLQALDGGIVWNRLYAEIFPMLRSARMVLLFRYVHPRVKIPETEAEPQMPELTLDIPTPTLDLLPMLHIRERRHIVSLSSNLLYDAFYMPNYGMAPMPNVQAEFFPATGPWSFRVGFLFPYYLGWNHHKFFQIRDYHLEVRRYWKPGILNTGAYLGAYINATKYGIGLNKGKGWQGEGAGAAVKLGYVLPLGSGRWRMDFHIAAGLWYTQFDPYVYGNPITGDESSGLYYYKWYGKKDDFEERRHRLMWFGPTELGVTLSFDVLYRKILGTGASFRRYEVF